MSSKPSRRIPHEEVDAEGSWAISYGDMITLLLTFFILFFNVDKREVEQRLAIQDALMVQLKQSAPAATIQIDKERSPASIDEQVVNQWGGHTFKLGERVIIEFPNTSFFDKGQTDVKKDALEHLVQFSKIYMPYMGQNMLSVRAFTDSLQVSPGHRYHDNLELSALRAISAMRVLQKSGLPLNVMRISGNGELPGLSSKLSKPHDGEPLSRKVVLVIEPLTKEKL